MLKYRNLKFFKYCEFNDKIMIKYRYTVYLNSNDK